MIRRVDTFMIRRVIFVIYAMELLSLICQMTPSKIVKNPTLQNSKLSSYFNIVDLIEKFLYLVSTTKRAFELACRAFSYKVFHVFHVFQYFMYYSISVFYIFVLHSSRL